MSATASLFYSNADPNTHVAGKATANAAVAGSTPVTITMTVPAPPTLPDSLLYSALLVKLAALNDFANQLTSEGKSSSAVIAQAQTGLTSSQYTTIMGHAQNRRSDVLSLNSGYYTASALLHSQGRSAAGATGSTATTLQSISSQAARCLQHT